MLSIIIIIIIINKIIILNLKSSKNIIGTVNNQIIVN